MNASRDAKMHDICLRAQAAARKAMHKFPQPNYVLTKVAEEAGEVVKAGVHLSEGRGFTWDDLEAECVQTIAMCLRLLVEGDGVIGLTPPDSDETYRRQMKDAGRGHLLK